MARLCIFVIAMIGFAGPVVAQEERVASKTAPLYANLRPLTNGLSALSMTWPLNSLAENRIEATHAGLATIVNGATETMTPFEAETFREINIIDFNLTLLPQHIMLTVTAPNDTFPDALDHLRDLLANPDFSTEWYARQSVQQRALLATKTRRPENVLGSLSDFMLFPNADDGTDTTGLSFRFGVPSHVVLRSEDRTAQNQVSAMLRDLPYQTDSTNYPAPIVNNLPNGVLFVPDPDSRETLLYVIKTETFDDATDMVGANMLMDYMGASQGSEMFRIIRQELRAAYNPASEFEQIDRDRALMGFSATVLATEWPAILSEIQGIYTGIQDGDATDQGLNNTKRRMLNGLGYRFDTNARWGAAQYMNEYANGGSGQINFPLFRAMVDADFNTIRANATEHLPPFDDFLVILIGGTTPPPDEMKANGYCEQSVSKPLRHCLKQLQ